jgi:ribosome-associated toxin RatA of RatAB toxin-antitoxin module
MGKMTKSIEIAESPNKVFAFVIDMKRMNDASKEWYVGNWTSEEPINLGSTMHYAGTKQRFNEGEEWDGVVTEFTKDKSLTMSLKGANEHSHDQTNYYVFEPTTKGTKVTFIMEYKAPSFILGRFVDSLVSREGTKMMESLKKAIEA